MFKVVTLLIYENALWKDAGTYVQWFGAQLMIIFLGRIWEPMIYCRCFATVFLQQLYHRMNLYNHYVQVSYSDFILLHWISFHTIYGLLFLFISNFKLRYIYWYLKFLFYVVIVLQNIASLMHFISDRFQYVSLSMSHDETILFLLQLQALTLLVEMHHQFLFSFLYIFCTNIPTKCFCTMVSSCSLNQSIIE